LSSIFSKKDINLIKTYAILELITLHKKGDNVMAVDLSKIKKVAIYLRKSRDNGETDDVLSKHRERLIEYATENNWQYDIFQEIVTGETLRDRPEIQKLLQKIEKYKYDAVLTIHPDRLSRGGSQDSGLINSVLKYANTYLLTPTRSYDLTDTGDALVLGVESVMSNTELNLIKSRFKWGKIQGVKQGRLSNGEPPYPYEKVRKFTEDEKGRIRVDFDIIVNQEKNEVYQRIKKMYLSGIGTERIAFQLNRENIPSPGNKKWSSNSVLRLLTHEFHIGKIIYGKYEWKKKPLTGDREVIKRDEDEWIIGYGDYQKLKTEEEHIAILEILSRNRKIPHNARHGAYPTSGLLTCKLCGRIMVYSRGRKEAKTGKTYDYTKCYYHTPEGIKCPQRGVKMTEEFYESLYNTIINSYLNKERIKQISQNQEEKKNIEKQIKRKQIELEKHENALKLAREKLEEGIYNDEDFLDTKKRRQPQIIKLRKKIIELENTRFTAYTDEELEKLIENFKQNWHNAITDEEKNQLLKTIVKKIYYNREGDTVTFEIEYL
jgi:site-specific DNA recombinase